jgi:hypothetical protein
VDALRVGSPQPGRISLPGNGFDAEVATLISSLNKVPDPRRRRAGAIR